MKRKLEEGARDKISVVKMVPGGPGSRVDVFLLLFFLLQERIKRRHAPELVFLCVSYPHKGHYCPAAHLRELGVVLVSCPVAMVKQCLRAKGSF